jgi:hemoglobin
MELYDYIGGETTIRNIGNTFYPKVLAHPMMRALHMPYNQAPR